MRRGRFYLLLVILAAGLFGAAWSARRLLAGLPDVHALDHYHPPLSTHVYDVNGESIAEFSIQRRALLSLDQIPTDLQNAVVAVEDDQFYQHWGISPRGIIRSALVDLLHRRVLQGASTITQQLAKQIFLKPERKLARKIREALLAVEIERNFSKQEILQYYLNQVYFGEGAYGVKAAARIYFGKEVDDLTLSDCALLAGLIRSPRGNDPFLHPEHARRRRAVVLQRMREEGMITAQEKREAEAQPLPLSKPIGRNTQAPYFVEHVRRRLEQEYGTNMVWRGGLKVYTTLDWSMEKAAEAGMEKALAAYDERALAEWREKQKEASPGVEISTSPPAKIQGAFVLLDVKTGAVRAMVGGRDSIFNRAMQARRQPGSTFKPFVWAAALQSGMTPASLVDDAPLAYYYDGRDWRLLEGATDQYSINLATAPFANSPDFKIWVPNDYDGKFLGWLTLRRALAHSRNTASVRLIEKVGPPVVVDLAHKLGIRSELDPVLSLGLGSAVVSPLEMASAFGTFANGGIYVEPYTIERVEDASGRRLESHVPVEREAVSPQLAFLMTDLLEAVVREGTGRNARRLGRPLAGKTGTSNDNRDLWFIGYTPDLVAAAWMGYDDYSSLGGKDWSGGATVVPWWTDIMASVLKDSPKRRFPVPPGIVYRKIDASTGMLALPTCPRRQVLLEAFLKGTEPKRFCSIDHSMPLQPQLAALENGPAAAAAPQPVPALAMAPALSTATLAPSPQSASPDDNNGGDGSQGEPKDEPVILQ